MEEFTAIENEDSLNENSDKNALYDNAAYNEQERMQLIRQSYIDIINIVSDAIYVLDQTFTFIEINKGAEIMYQYSREELIGLNPSSVAAQGLNDMEMIQNSLQRVLETGEPERFDFWAKRKNGEIFPKDVIVNRGKFFDQNVLIATARDMSHKIKNENVYKDNENRYEILLEKSGIGVANYTIDGKILYFNEKAIQHLGGKLEDYIGKSVLDVFGKEAGAEYVRRFQLVSGSENSLEFEDFVSFANRDYWFLSNLTKIIDEQGELVGIEVIAHEITDRKLAEKEIEQSQREFKDLFENAPIGYHEIDLEGRIVRINQTELNMLGYTWEELKGQFIWELVSDKALSIKATKEKLQNNQVSLVPYEREFVRKDGSTLSVLVMDKLITGDNAKVKGIRSSIQDITEQKIAAENIKLSKERYGVLLQHLETGIVVHARDTSIISNNPRASELLGLSSDQMRGKVAIDPAWRFLKPDNSTMSLEDYPVNRVLSSKLPIKNQILGIQKSSNSEIVWVNVNGFPVLNNENEIIEIVISFDDITSQRIAEQNLRESQAILQAAMDNSLAGIAIADAPNGKLRYVNEAGLFMRGEEKDRIVDNIDINEYVSTWQLLDLDGRELRPDEVPLARAIMFGEKSSREFIIRNKNNEDVIVLGKASPIRNEKDEVIAAVVVFQDITERKIFEQNLQERNNFIEKLVDLNPGMIYIYDLVNQRNVYSNEGIGRMLGYSVKEVQDMGDAVIPTLMHPDDLIGYINKILPTYPLLKDGEQLVHQYRMKSKNGEWHWIESMEIIYLRNEDQTPQQIFGMALDVTERKQADNKIIESERALKRQNELFDSLIRNLPMGVFMVETPSGKPLLANEAALKLLGRGILPDANRHNLQEVYDAYKIGTNERYPVDEMPIIRGMKGESSRIDNMLVKRPDGTDTLLEIFGSPVADENGNIWASMVSFMDISERKKAEKTLKESEDRFRKAVVNSPFPVMLHAEDGKVELINDEWIKVTGYSIHDIPTTALWTEKAYGIKKEMVREDIEKLYSITEKIDEGEYVVTTKTGENRSWYFSSTPLGITPDGRRLVMSMALDITERRKAEIKLQESEEKLSKLFGSMTEMVVIHELITDDLTNAIDYRILDCNDAFSIITGIKRQDAVGKLATEVYQTPEAPYIREYARVVATGESYEFDVYYEPMDKHFIISTVSIGENMFATIATDISEIQNAQKELKEKNQELENYIYVASHDLRSPLVNIQGFGQRLEKQTEKIHSIVTDGDLDETKKLEISKITHEDIPKSLNFILNNVAKMDTLINGLLQLSRTGRIVLSVNKVNMNKLLNDVSKAFNFQLTECNAKLNIEHLADCYGDLNQLNQVFSNIISNAIKYRDSSRKLEIEISSKVEQKRVRYSIKDNGIGISERQLEKIWDIFYRADASSQVAGDGLGLSLARRIVEKHKGKIWAESEVNVGSVFHIELQRNHFES